MSIRMRAKALAGQHLVPSEWPRFPCSGGHLLKIARIQGFLVVICLIKQPQEEQCFPKKETIYPLSFGILLTQAACKGLSVED